MSACHSTIFVFPVTCACSAECSKQTFIIWVSFVHSLLLLHKSSGYQPLDRPKKENQAWHRFTDKIRSYSSGERVSPSTLNLFHNPKQGECQQHNSRDGYKDGERTLWWADRFVWCDRLLVAFLVLVLGFTLFCMSPTIAWLVLLTWSAAGTPSGAMPKEC